jgi:hypothetical protein
MLLIAKVLTGFHFIVEEKLLDNYILDPLKVVGLEGMFGCTYFAILLPIFQHWSVTPTDLFPRGLVEDSRFAFE